MTTLTLNDPAIFSLHQLNKHVYWQTGFRCRLTNRVNLLRLLKFASYCKQKVIQRWYQAFLKHLSMKQLKLLLSYGIQLPQKIVQLLTSNKHRQGITKRLMKCFHTLFLLKKD